MACKGCQKQNLSKEALEALPLEELVDKMLALDSKNTVLCKITNQVKDLSNKKTKEEILLVNKEELIKNFLFLQGENRELTKKLIEDRKKRNNLPSVQKEVLVNKSFSSSSSSINITRRGI